MMAISVIMKILSLIFKRYLLFNKIHDPIVVVGNKAQRQSFKKLFFPHFFFWLLSIAVTTISKSEFSYSRNRVK